MKIFISLSSSRNPKDYAKELLEYLTSKYYLDLRIRQSNNKFIALVIDDDIDKGTGFVIHDVNESGTYRHVIIRRVIEGKRLWCKEIQVPNSVPKDKVMYYIIKSITPRLIAIV